MEQSTASTGWPIWLSRRETSEYLKEVHGIRLGVPGLAALARKGNGPPFARDGRFAVYPRDEVDNWARQRRSPLVRSTHELKRIRAQAVELEAA